MSTTPTAFQTSPLIHPSAIIEPGAQIAPSVKIGPFCHVGPEVVLGEEVELISHVVITGRTTLGRGTVVYPFASLGHRPQDRRPLSQESRLEIGENNIIREYVTMQPGTSTGQNVTQVGSHGIFMASAHIAHDCMVGDYVTMTNNATLGGHVIVGDYVNIGGLAAVHQFVRIGRHAMIGGMSGVKSDVIPYGLVMSRQARLSGLNLVGLKRRGFTPETIKALREAYRDIFTEELDIRPMSLSDRVTEAQKTYQNSPEASEIIAFIQATGSRPLLTQNSAEG